MADIPDVDADYEPGSDATFINTPVQGGEAINPNAPVFLDTNDNKYYYANASAGVNQGKFDGIAASKCQADLSYFVLQNGGSFKPGVAGTESARYFISENDDKIADAEPATSGSQVVQIGYSKSDGFIKINKVDSGVKP